MRTSSWLAIIGVSLLTFIILVFTGSISFKIDDGTETTTSANNSKVVSIVRDYETPTQSAVPVVDLDGIQKAA